MVVLPLVLAQRVLPAWQRSECHLPRAGNTAAADVCGSWLVSLPRPGRVEGPNNSSTRGTSQQLTFFGTVPVSPLSALLRVGRIDQSFEKRTNTTLNKPAHGSFQWDLVANLASPHQIRALARVARRQFVLRTIITRPHDSSASAGHPVACGSALPPVLPLAAADP